MNNQMSWGQFLRELAVMTSVTAIDRFLNRDDTPVTVVKPKIRKPAAVPKKGATKGRT